MIIMIGIYKIVNNINGKIYIGQSDNIARRWRQHRNRASFSTNDEHIVLYRAIKKYGINNFSFEVVEECSREQLNEKEKYYIKLYNSEVPNGYNLTSGGNSSFKMKLTLEQVKEIKELLKNTNISQTEIAEKFQVSQVTISDINIGEAWITDNEEYPIRKYYKGPNHCKKCGAICDRQSTYCIKCFPLILRKVERPSRDELKKLIRTETFTSIGKKYNIARTAISKWCVSYNLPSTKKEIKKLYR